MPLIDVEIEKLVYGGAGLARLEDGTALVSYVLPGERLSAEVTKKTGATRHAVPAVFERESEDRVRPLCPLFTDCGGCHYQHIPYEKQLEFKRVILLETLARLGKIEWNSAVETLAAEPLGYRNRAQLRVVKRGRRAEVGFSAAGSHRFVAATDCPINSPKLDAAHEALREMARDRRFPEFLREVEFFTNETDVQINVVETDRPLAKSFFTWAAERIAGLAAGEYVDYPSGGDLFRVGGRSFFQINRFLTARLAEEVVGDAAGGTALDLYAGVGLFSLPLARRFERVVAVDSSGAAARSLQVNAERAGLEVGVAHANVDAYLADCSETVDCVVLDPPRAGIGAAVVEQLLRLRPREIRLVSCDPATLARDLAGLTAGGYVIERLAFADLFPQTFHIETVVRLRL